ncbi:MAG: peptidoglycan DD-metalloendopeptidase family protein [bacterium]
MHKFIKKIISYLIILILVFNINGGCFLVKASEVILNQPLNEREDTEDIAEELKTEDIKDLQNLITNKQQEIEGLNGQIDHYKDLIKVKEEQANTLESQISILENQIAKKELDIKKLEAQIQELALEIEKTNREIKDAEEKIVLQKERIAENIRIINRNDDKNYLELFLANDKFSNFFDSAQSLKNLEEELKRIYDDLIILKKNLNDNKLDLENKNSELKNKKQSLNDEKEKLNGQQYSKEVILAQTIETSAEFRRLVAQIQQEQNQTFAQIKKLEADVKQKLEQEREKRKNQGKPIDNPSKLSWPIPNQGITTSFHDPDYPFKKWIGEHSGIDLRTLKGGVPTNGLPVKSAADGIVIKIVREGKLAGNIVYIMHNDDLMTVYMHLSRIDVKEDQYISRGETIGLSGGMPGTPGAGQISTGPHLHFEVRLKGIPVNPMNYLQ